MSVFHRGPLSVRQSQRTEHRVEDTCNRFVQDQRYGCAERQSNKRLVHRVWASRPGQQKSGGHFFSRALTPVQATRYGRQALLSRPKVRVGRWACSHTPYILWYVSNGDGFTPT